jgi:hypothetical protein
MSERNTVLRSMHDIGLAGWFGGSLMGAVGLNGAAAQAANPAERLQIASAGWDRWGPVNLAAIGVHLAGAAGILVSEAPRVATQKGVGATVYSRLAGKKMEKAGGAPVDGITEPAASTPGDVSAAQRQQRVAQWMVPVLTGALWVVSSLAGEQQKPGPVRRGVGARVRQFLTPSA